MSKVTDDFYIDPHYQLSEDQLKNIPEDVKKAIPQTPEPYYCDSKSGLIKAVNLAIYLRRPLLLEGEAGCGKTRLARAVAHKLQLPYHRWDVRSNSKAQDALYTYDAILRLHDVQIEQLPKSSEEETHKPQDNPQNKEKETKKRDPSNPKDYRTLGALGKAFDFKESPSVVLIDEIDKASIDFPNDLLTVLDEPWKFTIPETGETIAATEHNRPIVIITSNREKGNLPAPFLRRCIYFYLEFPKNQLQQIVDTHDLESNQAQQVEKGKKAQAKDTKDIVTRAIECFLKIREDDSLVKKPGTSEFLDWIEALRSFDAEIVNIAEQLITKNNPIPYPELLFKHSEDWLKDWKISEDWLKDWGVLYE